MKTSPEAVYHDGMRRLQDRFDTRRLADRLDERLGRAEFSDEDRAFIESRSMFLFTTADARGRPDCSYKGGAAGFVRVIDRNALAFPSDDGNGMFRSLGNVLVNPAVALLFVDFEEPRQRQRARLTRRSAARELRGRATRGACPCDADLSELPALRPPDGARRSIALRAARRLRAADTGVETHRCIPRRAAARRSGARHLTARKMR